MSVLFLSFSLIFEVESLFLNILCAVMCEVGGIGDEEFLEDAKES